MSYTEQLERDSEAARRRLAEDLDELRERITPGQLVDQLVDYVQEGSGGTFFRNLKRQTLGNPLPVTLIGAGLAWLMLARGGNDGGAPAARRWDTSAARNQIGDAADTAVRSTAEFAASTSDAAARAFGTAAERASRTSAAFAEGARSAGRNAAGAGRDVFDFAREQPYLLAGIGIAFGAALAAILPRTQAEDNLLGEASDKARAAASDALSSGYDNATAVGEQVLEAGKEEAEKQGLASAPTRSDDRGDSRAAIAAGPPSDARGEEAEHGAHETTPHGAA